MVKIADLKKLKHNHKRVLLDDIYEVIKVEGNRATIAPKARNGALVSDVMETIHTRALAKANREYYDKYGDVVELQEVETALKEYERKYLGYTR